MVMRNTRCTLTSRCAETDRKKATLKNQYVLFNELVRELVC